MGWGIVSSMSILPWGSSRSIPCIIGWSYLSLWVSQGFCSWTSRSNRWTKWRCRGSFRTRCPRMSQGQLSCEWFCRRTTIGLPLGHTWRIRRRWSVRSNSVSTRCPAGEPPELSSRCRASLQLFVSFAVEKLGKTTFGKSWAKSVALDFVCLLFVCLFVVVCFCVQISIQILSQFFYSSIHKLSIKSWI